MGSWLMISTRRKRRARRARRGMGGGGIGIDISSECLTPFSMPFPPSPLTPRSPWLIRRMLLVAAVLVLALAGCARKAPPLPPPVVPVYPYSADVAKAFYATASGLSEMAFQGEAEAELPASKAPNASILSSDGKAIVVAVNGWGVERIEASPDGRTYRLVDSPLPALFPGLCTGGAWPTGGGFLIQLFRDPFGDPPPSGAVESGAVEARVPASRLVFFDGAGGAATTPNPFPRDLDPGFELFALLPAGGTWFAELRKDAAERVDLKFLAIGDPLSLSGPVREIRRAEFEAALTPLPFSSLAGETKAALGSALRLLGKGPWLARVRSGAGEDRWYLSSGKAEEAAPCLRLDLHGRRRHQGPGPEPRREDGAVGRPRRGNGHQPDRPGGGRGLHGADGGGKSRGGRLGGRGFPLHFIRRHRAGTCPLVHRGYGAIHYVRDTISDRLHGNRGSPHPFVGGGRPRASRGDQAVMGGGHRKPPGSIDRARCGLAEHQLQFRIRRGDAAISRIPHHFRAVGRFLFLQHRICQWPSGSHLAGVQLGFHLGPTARRARCLQPPGGEHPHLWRRCGPLPRPPRRVLRRSGKDERHARDEQLLLGQGAFHNAIAPGAG